ncbi:MAG: methylamine utilization protein [Gammaproteobacteria bacterium]|jgi:plastocyanin|nr:methylamine utilization protein [Gammaproteobacteria bacterium]
MTFNFGPRQLRPAMAGLLFLLAFSSLANAAALVVSVSGESGQPIEDAVISLQGVSGAPGHSELKRHVVDQKGRQFRPWVTAATVGEDVVIRNSDEITHHVYSFSPTRQFSFRLQEGEAHAAMTMSEAGVIVMGCNIHDWMVGYVHVADGQYSSTTDEQGLASWDGLPTGNWRVSLWHPGIDEVAEPPPQHVELQAGASTRIAFEVPGRLRETGPREPPEDHAY